MTDAYLARTTSVDGGPTALGSAGSFTMVTDRPASAMRERSGLQRGTAVEPRRRRLRSEALADLVAHVDSMAEIPNSLRRGTEVRLRSRAIAAGG